MSEYRPEAKEVAVLFYNESSLLIPPFEVPRETLYPNKRDTYEKAYYRLCEEHGVASYVDKIAPSIEGSDLFRLYVTKARNGELNDSPFFVPFESVDDYLKSQNGLAFINPTDRRLVQAARDLLLFNS